MKSLFLFSAILVFFSGCTNDKKEKAVQADNKIALRTDTINVVQLTDSLVIYESTCRGCAYESSTAFAIKDSLEMIRLLNVETADHNSPDIAGGTVSKNLILVPVKTGTTVLKLYKFWEGIPSNMNDSLPFTPFTIEVRN